MKISTVWEEFDSFIELVKNSRNFKSKEILNKNISPNFNSDFTEFKGNWNQLLDAILLIFKTDKTLLNKMDYDKIQKEKFLDIYFNSPILVEVKKELFAELSKTSLNYFGQTWGEKNESYKKEYNIFLMDDTYSKYFKITGYKSYVNKQFFVDICKKDQVLYNLVFNFDGNELKSIKYVGDEKSITNAFIKKYPEVLMFINIEFFNIQPKIDTIQEFLRYITSFSLIGDLKVPVNNDGYLKSYYEGYEYIGYMINNMPLNERIDKVSKQVKNYCNLNTVISNQNKNIISFEILNIREFKVRRKSDNDNINAISEVEAYWNEKRVQKAFNKTVKNFKPITT